jgi:hypothetical protein
MNELLNSSRSGKHESGTGRTNGNTPPKRAYEWIILRIELIIAPWKFLFTGNTESDLRMQKVPVANNTKVRVNYPDKITCKRL